MPHAIVSDKRPMLAAIPHSRVVDVIRRPKKRQFERCSSLMQARKLDLHILPRSKLTQELLEAFLSQVFDVLKGTCSDNDVCKPVCKSDGVPRTSSKRRQPS